MTAPRWRNPAGWSLRTRLIAIMIVLLAVLGLVLGAATEVYLHQALHRQVAEKLAVDVRQAPFFFGYHIDGGGPGGPGPGGRRAIPATPCVSADTNRVRSPDGPGGGPDTDTLTLCVAGGTTVGGIVQPATTVGGERTFDPPAPDQLGRLLGVPEGRTATVDVGSHGDYLVQTRSMPDGATVVTGRSLAQTQTTLLQLTAVIAVVLVLLLLTAGWAGAVIIRRTLRPLSRVAATATRVSELKLERGEPELTLRVPDEDTDPRTEVGQVGAALNRMLDHVGSALEARHASEMQVRQFVADASHELRTPLAAIRGYAELSRRSRNPVPDEVAHVLRRVESEAQRMTTLVDDLLLLARLDAGRPLAHETVDLTMLVVDAVSDAHAAGPGHSWQLDVPEDPVTVTGDPARLHQVLANLLANARTHTPEGTTVTVRVGRDGDQAVAEVIDGGPGIPAELQPYIFERFARGDNSRSRAAGSTGLGLAIVAAVVAAHHGRVTVESAPGRTAFAVRLPSAVEQSAVEQSAVDPSAVERSAVETGEIPDAGVEDVPEFVQ